MGDNKILTDEKGQPLDYHSLNAMLNIYGDDGKIRFDMDKEAARQFFLQHVNQNTVFFHTLREKLDFLIDNEYYEKEVLDQYDFPFVKSLFQQAYAHKFRFPTFLGAYKYYTSYTLKTFDGSRYLERYEDRVCMNALTLAEGDKERARHLVDEIITGRLQPATPTFLNAGKKQRGEPVSCFLLRIEDNMESIGRAINSSSSSPNAVEEWRSCSPTCEKRVPHQTHREPVFRRHPRHETARRCFLLREPAGRTTGSGSRLPACSPPRHYEVPGH